MSVNPNQYTNWVNLGNIYSAFTSFGIDKSYETGMLAYKRAEVLNPKNPLILLLEAQLEVNNKNTSSALDLVNKALALKPDYADALKFKNSLQGSQAPAN